MEKVMILGLPYKIEETKNIETPEVIGRIDYQLQLILLKEDLGKEHKEQTLLHEIVHGLLFGIGEKDLSNDERLVQGLASALHLLLKHNDFTFMREEKTNEHREHLSSEKASDSTQS